MDILELIDNYNGYFLVLFSFVVALATSIYVFLTFDFLKETRKLREPDMSLLIYPNEMAILPRDDHSKYRFGARV